jgi:hypothetical protein
MTVLGVILIVLSIPLFGMFALNEGEKKNKGQLKLGVVMAVVGLLIIVIPR